MKKAFLLLGACVVALMCMAATAYAIDESITFDAKNREISISPLSTDLFGELAKNLMPGDTPSGTVRLVNVSGAGKVYFSAHHAQSDKFSHTDNQAKSDDFMNKLSLRIFLLEGDATRVLYEGPANGSVDKTLLCVFDGPGEKALYWDIAVPEDLPVKYEAALGKTTWFFGFEESGVPIDEDPWYEYLPKTGDSFTLVVLACGLVLIGIAFFKRARKDESA